MNRVPDSYRYRAQSVDTRLFDDVYNYFVEHGGIAEGSELYRKNDGTYARTKKPIEYQDLKVHLQSEPLVRGGLFRQQHGMAVEMIVLGSNIESKLEDVITRFNFELKEKNPF